MDGRSSTSHRRSPVGARAVRSRAGSCCPSSSCSSARCSLLSGSRGSSPCSFGRPRWIPVPCVRLDRARDHVPRHRRQAVLPGRPLPGPARCGCGRDDDWLERGPSRAPMTCRSAAIALSALVSAVLALPVLPAGDAGPAMAANGDVGETIGWPQFATHRRAGLSPRGPTRGDLHLQLRRGGGDRPLRPRARPPGAPTAGTTPSPTGALRPTDTDPVVVVGLDSAHAREPLHRVSTRNPCRQRSRSRKMTNEERGIELCAGTRQSWSGMWRDLRHFD